jgi:DNA-binding NtrC family response regulator
MKILVADDERIQRETLSAILADHGHEPIVSGNVLEAMTELQSQDFDMVLTDYKMPDGTGVDVAKKTRQLCPNAPVFIMTAYADVASVIEAMRAGVVDYLLKPLNVDHLLRKIALIGEHRALEKEVIELRSRISLASPSMLLGESESIKKVRDTIAQVAQTKGTVLITGESGTGKEVAARLIHKSSADASRRFVAVNCAAIPENLMESELFGHKKGAFTGAVSDKEGLFKAASGGTIFLDEIGELPRSLQAKLLRVLQEREITPVGDTKPTKIDIRLIAATNRDLAADVADGLFRQDLFYRINVVQLKMPPLRDHAEDVPALAQHFIRKYAKELRRKEARLSSAASRRLMEYHWPGNIRELENVVERAMILGVNGGVLEPVHLPEIFHSKPDQIGEGSASHMTPLSLDQAVNAFVKRHIQKTLDAVQNDKKQAARYLGLSLSSLYRKLDDLGINLKATENTQ